jgi:ABC-2 type transport system ATP-binding protein
VFDAPCLHPNLTVRQVLRHAVLLCGPRSRPPVELEELLGLGRYRRVKIRKLSLGNRRRAAIANALVNRPSLVVLDEPFSGLDAAGIDDLLALIEQENRQQGTTFLLASHQLPYLERICTHVGILTGGRIARGGTVGELLAGQTARLWLRVDDGDRARALLQAQGDVRSIEERPDGRLVVEGPATDAAAVNRALVAAGLAVSELHSAPPSLEALFREIVGGRP